MASLIRQSFRLQETPQAWQNSHPPAEPSLTAEPPILEKHSLFKPILLVVHWHSAKPCPLVIPLAICFAKPTPGLVLVFSGRYYLFLFAYNSYYQVHQLQPFYTRFKEARKAVRFETFVAPNQRKSATGVHEMDGILTDIFRDLYKYA